MKHINKQHIIFVFYNLQASNMYNSVPHDTYNYILVHSNTLELGVSAWIILAT